MRVVSRRLGHSDVQTTMNTYAHVTEDAELRALADVTPELGESDVDDEHVQCVMSAEAAKIVTGSCR